MAALQSVLHVCTVSVRVEFLNMLEVVTEVCTEGTSWVEAAWDGTTESKEVLVVLVVITVALELFSVIAMGLEALPRLTEVVGCKEQPPSQIVVKTVVVFCVFSECGRTLVERASIVETFFSLTGRYVLL